MVCLIAADWRHVCTGGSRILSEDLGGSTAPRKVSTSCACFVGKIDRWEPAASEPGVKESGAYVARHVRIPAPPLWLESFVRQSASRRAARRSEGRPDSSRTERTALGG